MRSISVRTSPSVKLKRENTLAWNLALVASDKKAKWSSEATQMAINRIIDNAGVALASVNRPPVIAARAQAMAHPRKKGASIFGIAKERLFDCEWAAWANGVAVRELDFHDTFLAADYSHPADSIPTLIAVAEQCGKSGKDLLRGIIAAYEVHVSLVKSISLHEFKKDHIAHLCPAQAAGIGALLGLEKEIIYQAIQQAVHVSFTTRQSRKGEISSWKAFAPAHAGKLAVEAVDRAMRGEKSPSPIYEGEDGVIAYMLGGKSRKYRVVLPKLGQSREAILETYTKEYSAEYQAQSLIDLARKMRTSIKDLSAIKKIIIHTSHHTHHVIGTGSNDPEKFDPNASRETLDHSIMYIFAVALEDGAWHHINSYTKERATRRETVALWKKIETQEDPYWTNRYHDNRPEKKAYGAQVEILFKDGKRLTDKIALADAHPRGRRPFGREEYINKFSTLSEGIISLREQKRFLELVQNLDKLRHKDILSLNPIIDLHKLKINKARGIF